MGNCSAKEPIDQNELKNDVFWGKSLIFQEKIDKND